MGFTQQTIILCVSKKDGKIKKDTRYRDAFFPNKNTTHIHNKKKKKNEKKEEKRYNYFQNLLLHQTHTTFSKLFVILDNFSRQLLISHQGSFNRSVEVVRRDGTKKVPQKVEDSIRIFVII